MKIRSVAFNNRKKGFQVRTREAVLWFPYGKLEVRPTADDPVVRGVQDVLLRTALYPFVRRVDFPPSAVKFDAAFDR